MTAEHHLKKCVVLPADRPPLEAHRSCRNASARVFRPLIKVSGLLVAEATIADHAAARVYAAFALEAG